MQEREIVLGCLVIASKFDEKDTNILSQKQLVRLLMPTQPIDQTQALVQAELKILLHFDFNIKMPTLHDFLALFV